MSNNYYDPEVIERVKKALIETVERESTIVRHNVMPGKYNAFDINDLPEDMRKLMEKKEQEIVDKLMIPKEIIEKDHMDTQLEVLRKQMEYERERYARHDPVQRELRDLRNEVEYLKDAMRRIGVLLDTDLPDEKMFDEFKMLREAFKKYKMVEKLVLGEDK
jgi:hypothetical protein